MSSPADQLERGLRAILQLPPPGVKADNIKSLSDLCAQNVEVRTTCTMPLVVGVFAANFFPQFQTVIIQKLLTHYKGSPPDYMLAFLYVADAVLRKWIGLADSYGQAVSSGAREGAYGSAVYNLKSLMRTFIYDFGSRAPAVYMVSSFHYFLRTQAQGDMICDQ